jgi:hypothetical protein
MADTSTYLTTDEFFDILKIAFEDTYGSDHTWHPEDMYVNLKSTLEIVTNTLSNLHNIRNNKQLTSARGWFS